VCPPFCFSDITNIDASRIHTKWLVADVELDTYFFMGTAGTDRSCS
jgi:hypothetical protein